VVVLGSNNDLLSNSWCNRNDWSGVRLVLVVVLGSHNDFLSNRVDMCGCNSHCPSLDDLSPEVASIDDTVGGIEGESGGSITVTDGVHCGNRGPDTDRGDPSLDNGASEMSAVNDSVSCIERKS
jgi:hypothetical protein